jgi:hypothetical protein
MNELNLLPDHLRKASYSDREIVLPYHEALLAIDIIVDAKWGLIGWEGWVLQDEGIGHHQEYQGTVSLSPEQGETWIDFVERSAEFCRSTIVKDQQRFEKDPSCRGMTLLFCLTASPRDSEAG